MRTLLLLLSLAMPAVAWFSQQGAFGPDNGTISDRYPTLLVAAGYAFAVWGVIFALDLAFGLWQLRRDDATLRRVRPFAIIGFAMTAAWMPLFSQQWFGLALAVIWTALAGVLCGALALSNETVSSPGRRWLAWLPLSLHAGWLSLAAFLNTAQVVVAYELLPTAEMLPWSLLLFAFAATLLLAANARMRGNWAYVAVALWGLVAVYAKQSGSALPGAGVAAWTALALGAALLLQLAWLRLRRPG